MVGEIDRSSQGSSLLEEIETFRVKHIYGVYLRRRTVEAWEEEGIPGPDWFHSSRWAWMAVMLCPGVFVPEVGCVQHDRSGSSRATLLEPHPALYQVNR